MTRYQITHARFEILSNALHISLEITGLSQRIKTVCNPEDLLPFATLTPLSLKSVCQYLRSQSFRNLSEKIQFQGSHVGIDIGSMRRSGKSISLKLAVANDVAVAVQDRVGRVEARMDVMERLFKRERGEKEQEVELNKMMMGLFLEMEKMKRERETAEEKMEEITRKIGEVEYRVEEVRTETTNFNIISTYNAIEEPQVSLQIDLKFESSNIFEGELPSPRTISKMPNPYLYQYSDLL